MKQAGVVNSFENASRVVGGEAFHKFVLLQGNEEKKVYIAPLGKGQSLNMAEGQEPKNASNCVRKEGKTAKGGKFGNQGSVDVKKGNTERGDWEQLPRRAGKREVG